MGHPASLAGGDRLIGRFRFHGLLLKESDGGRFCRVRGEVRHEGDLKRFLD